MDKLNVVELQQPNLMDVPASLRRLADQMDSGEVNAAIRCVVISEDANGAIESYGYGQISGTNVEEIGLLELAKLKLAIE